MVRKIWFLTVDCSCSLNIKKISTIKKSEDVRYNFKIVFPLKRKIISPWKSNATKTKLQEGHPLVSQKGYFKMEIG